MSYLALYRSSRWTVTVDDDALHLPAAELPALAQALDLARHVEGVAEAETARVQAAIDEGRAEGRREGRSAGLAEARAEALEKWTETLAQLQGIAEQERHELRQALAEISLLVVRRVLAELPPEQVLRGLVQRAIEQTEDRRALSVKVHPDVHHLLTTPRPHAPWADTPVEFIADPALGPWACEVSTPTGRLLAGLEDQLARVQDSLSEALRQTSNGTAANDAAAASAPLPTDEDPIVPARRAGGIDSEASLAGGAHG